MVAPWKRDPIQSSFDARFTWCVNEFDEDFLRGERSRVAVADEYKPSFLENGCWTETSTELIVVELWTDFVERKEDEIVKSVVSEVAGALFKIFDIFRC